LAFHQRKNPAWLLMWSNGLTQQVQSSYPPPPWH
jgi:hypothetical protein